MCGRSSLTKTQKELEERFQSSFYSDDLVQYNPLPNFNVAPTNQHPVIINEDPDHIRLFKWGLIPFWAKDEKIASRLINARVETLAEKGSFKHALKKRRCIVPFDGFYEWMKTDEGKQPYRIFTTNTEIFTIAGLWERWKNESGDTIHTFTLITQAPNAKLSRIHDRMPAILLPEQEALWLDESMAQEEALQLISPYPEEYIDYYPVSTQVNNVRNNSPELIEAIEISKGKQGSLF